MLFQYGLFCAIQLFRAAPREDKEKQAVSFSSIMSSTYRAFQQILSLRNKTPYES